MKKLKKTYAVLGMMEYQAIIHVGKNSRLRVHFSEGSATSVGTIPARFTTDNLMYQHAIENSYEFKSGKIYLYNTIETGEEIELYAEPTSAKAAPAQAADAETIHTLTEMTFACNDDAKDFLCDKFDAKRSALRSRADIVAFGKEHAIEVLFQD